MILTKNGNLMKFASGAAVNAIIPPDPTEIEYYNFGNSETLVTNVAKSIDLTNTGIVNANKKYVVLYGEYILSNSYNDGSSSTILFNNGQTTIFSLGIGYGTLTGFLIRLGTSSYSRIAQFQGTKYVKVLLSENYDNNISDVYTSYNDSNVGNNWTNFVSKGTVNCLAKDFSALVCTGGGNGLLTATNFIAKGFDNIEDASAWNPIV